MNILSKRNILGAALFLVLVGEPAVAAGNGFYTLPGFIVLAVLYYLLFLLYEALAIRYHLTYGRLVLLTFGIYSVLVTGLLHGELANYVLQPHNDLVTTLIRIQCSFFPLFAYYLLNKFTKRDPTHIPRLRIVLMACLVYLVVLTPTGLFGFKALVNTVQTAPVISVIFALTAVVAIAVALRPSSTHLKGYNSKVLTVLAMVLFILCLIPFLPSFFVVLLVMPLVGGVYLLRPAFRQARV